MRITTSSYNPTTNCYTINDPIRISCQLAASLKKLLTILLLLILAGQIPGLIHTKGYETGFILEAEEKGEKNGEDKSEKKFFPHHNYHNEDLPVKRSYDLHSCDLFLSHVLDLHTPPPDLSL